MSYAITMPLNDRMKVEQFCLNRSSLKDLRSAADSVSRRYRRENKPLEGFQIQNEDEACAYMLARMPATYAANARVLAELKRLRPDFSPQSVLDMGAGPATASLVTQNFYGDSITHMNLVESNPFFVALGCELWSPSLLHATWHAEKIENFMPKQAYDLVIFSYVLNEIPLDSINKILEKMWLSCSDAMIICESGTPLGAGILAECRDMACARPDMHILAPCTHRLDCPLQGLENQWCHFSARTPRSKIHKDLKGGDVGYEDEKFSYIILSRHERALRDDYRVIGRPLAGKVVALPVCSAQGVETINISKSNKLYKKVKKMDWGDAF